MPQVKTGAPHAVPAMQPTEADIALLRTAQSAELTVRDLYNAALAAGSFPDAQLSVLELFRDHHTAYAQSLNGLLSKSAASTRSESMYSSYLAQVQSANTSLLALQTLENILVATYIDIVGSLVSLNGANLAASILIVEAGHAAVFGSAPTFNITSALNDDAVSLITTDTVEG